MQVPALSRARDLLAGTIAALPWRHYGTQWTGEDVEEVPLPPLRWMYRPQDGVSRSWVTAWIVDGMMLHGRAHLHVESRYSDGYPASFRVLPPEIVGIEAGAFYGNAPLGPYTITVNGVTVPNRDIVSFWSPFDPVLEDGATAILTSIKLDRAALRFAATPMAMGWLEVSGGEPLDQGELDALAEGWVAKREANAVSALQGVTWNESDVDPVKLQLVESRAYQALEIARVAGVSPDLLGAPTGSGQTYRNALVSLQQLTLVDAAPYIDVIEETLSSDQVLPQGRIVRLDRDRWTEQAGLMAEPSADPTPAGREPLEDLT